MSDLSPLIAPKRTWKLMQTPMHYRIRPGALTVCNTSSTLLEAPGHEPADQLRVVRGVALSYRNILEASLLLTGQRRPLPRAG
jgi:hypothetical protein